MSGGTPHSPGREPDLRSPASGPPRAAKNLGRMTEVGAAVSPAATSVEVRENLVDALKLDLIGPGAGHELASERLPVYEAPSNWYLTGFLIPSGTPAAQSGSRDGEDDDGDLEEVPERAGLTEESNEDRKAAKKAFFPSSMGLSFLAGDPTFQVTVRWGDYERCDRSEEKGDSGASRSFWQRMPREEVVPVDLRTGQGAGADPVEYDVPASGGLKLHVVHRHVPHLETIPAGALAVTVFLSNDRQPAASLDEQETTYAFQTEVEVRSDRPFLRRPDPRSAQDDWDEQVAALHHARTPNYATGHNVSAEWDTEEDGSCRTVRTAWIPGAQVEKTETFEPPGVDLSMDRLGELASAAEAEAALQPLLSAYRQWIGDRQADARAIDDAHADTAAELLRRARLAADRIERGIAALCRDERALDAFRVANRAIAQALRRRNPKLFGEDEPRWRAFQLAFILLNLAPLADPEDPHREYVDLLFFPTGGGKTEAYLGLAAFAIVLRRLRHPEDGCRAGGGVSVIMRYTLRLLTLDQLARAAAMICALELERTGNPARYGDWPFEIGLWVGKAATPNVLGRKGDGNSQSARAWTDRYKREPGRHPAPVPLESCPWCGTEFEPDSFSLEPDKDRPRNLRVTCADWECDFSGDRGLPIVAVDEPLYRRLPCFLIATVDKFAALPWEARSGALLGGADRCDDYGFHGAAEPGLGRPLPAPLLGPDLIVQDELHLIAGPLGSMTGLYETAIEALVLRHADGRRSKPRIVASTATTRHAQQQIQALFGRPRTQVFPPPGLSRRDSFFAQVKPPTERAARLYLGIASPGRNAKVMMRRVLLPLMAAAQKAYRDAGGKRNKANPADPYMTVLAYFNSLRELGGARRIVEEEVQNTLRRYGGRLRIGQERRIFQDRPRFVEPLELTSRVSTAEVAKARQRLALSFHEKKRVDCALATNMISVGLDIQRLGLMVVLGQPKTNAEYIQATSRVGRDDNRPGLVLTLFNVHKPRDRSHYESFRHYHETFYRAVEAGSVTPFAARALDRGMAGALVALARHAEPSLTPALGLTGLADVREEVERCVIEAFTGRLRDQPMNAAEREEKLRSVRSRTGDLLDSWQRVVDGYREVGAVVKYQRHEGPSGKPLLREMLDTEFESEHHRKFRANRSLRDVEPEVHLYVQDPAGSGEP